jgi:protein ImuB
MERSDLPRGQAENIQLRKSAKPTDSSHGKLSRADYSTNASGTRPNAKCSIADKSVQKILPILRKWGIHTLGQLAALDREELGRRLGQEAVRLWERANGTSNRLLKFVRPPELFEESFEFEKEIETAQPLLFILRRFLEELSLRLNAIYLVAKELSLRITFSNLPQDGSAGADNEHYERCFKIPQPTNDVDLLFRMLQTHLENFKSKHPIISVALTAHPIKPASQQFGLFETALRNPQQLYETLARLSALLGTERVGTPVLEESHRPDAFRMEPFAWKSGESAVPSGEFRQSGSEPDALRTAHTTAGIALRRFRPAVSASIFIAGQWHLQSEKIRGKVIDQRGPYLLSGNWWDEKSWARTEWDLQLENGELLRFHHSNGKWKIDGIYD